MSTIPASWGGRVRPPRSTGPTALQTIVPTPTIATTSQVELSASSNRRGTPP